MTNVTTVSTVSHEGGRAISLHELNNRLERYISQIQLDPDTPDISIAVDRVSEGGSFSMEGTPEYEEYEKMVSRTLIIIGFNYRKIVLVTRVHGARGGDCKGGG